MSDFRTIGRLPDPVNWRGAAVMAFDGQGRALMQLRDNIEGIAAPGRWSLFGGAVEAGESLDTAARREFFEETGIDISHQALDPFFRFGSQARRDGIVHVFRLKAVIEDQVQLGEGAGFAFLTRDQVEKFDVIENFRAALLAPGGFEK